MILTYLPLLMVLILGIILAFLKNRIEKTINLTGFLIFGERKAGVYLYFILFFPGIILHEVSHLFMAEILGVPTGEINLFPKVIDKETYQLGITKTAKANPIKEGLIGLAPFITGIAAILFIFHFLLGLPIINILSPQLFLASLSKLNLADPARLVLSGYLTFAFSNTMFLSDSDRRSWIVLPILAGLFATFLFATGILQSQLLWENINGLANYLNAAFLFAIVVDLIFFLPLRLLTVLMEKPDLSRK